MHQSHLVLLRIAALLALNVLTQGSPDARTHPAPVALAAEMAVIGNRTA